MTTMTPIATRHSANSRAFRSSRPRRTPPTKSATSSNASGSPRSLERGDGAVEGSAAVVLDGEREKVPMRTVLRKESLAATTPCAQARRAGR